MTDNRKIYFNGRTDGLGNRIEELIKLSCYCKHNSTICEYRWNNSRKRKYDILIRFQDIHMQYKRVNPNNIDTNELPIENFNTKWWNFLFELPPLPKFIAIHLRGGDRIRKTYFHPDYTTTSELEKIMKRTIDYVNNEIDLPVVVFSDDAERKGLLISQIEKPILNIDYHIQNSNEISPEWVDYYYMTHAHRIVMCGRFSTFSITAAVLGDVELVSFFPETDTGLCRFGAKVKVLPLEPDLNKLPG